jgi:hypothetical protein
VLDGHVARLRAEADVPNAATLPAADLEGSLGTLLAEVSRALVLIDQAGGESSAALRDGTEIQRVLAERHGAQRAALGWAAPQLQREFVLLGESLSTAVRAVVAADADAAASIDVDGTVEVLARLLAHAERVAERARRAAAPERASRDVRTRS